MPQSVSFFSLFLQIISLQQSIKSSFVIIIPMEEEGPRNLLKSASLYRLYLLRSGREEEKRKWLVARHIDLLFIFCCCCSWSFWGNSGWIYIPGIWADKPVWSVAQSRSQSYLRCWTGLHPLAFSYTRNVLLKNSSPLAWQSTLVNASLCILFSFRLFSFYPQAALH